MAQDDEFFIGSRTSKRSGSQGSPKTHTSKGGGSSQSGIKLGAFPNSNMSFTKRLAKDMAKAKRSSGRRTYAKPNKPRTGRFNARGRGRSALERRTLSYRQYPAALRYTAATPKPEICCA